MTNSFRSPRDILAKPVQVVEFLEIKLETSQMQNLEFP